MIVENAPASSPHTPSLSRRRRGNATTSKLAEGGAYQTGGIAMADERDDEIG